MDAKQLKPYTFWIVCGVIVLIELGLFGFYQIENEDGYTPERVKDKLDDDYKKLENLYERAGREPKGVFDAEDQKDIDNLTKLYLLTPRWKDVLQPHVDKYNSQLAALKKDLTTRSAILHEPIADSGDLFSWYTTYAGKTKEILIKLRNAKCLDIKPDSAEDNDFENGSNIRTRVGFFTKGEQTPAASQHPLLTTRFRIMEKLTAAIMQNGSNSLDNPVVKTTKNDELANKKNAIITAVEWKQVSDHKDTLQNDVGQYAGSYELTITLEGSTSTLVATEAAIERIAEPVFVVVGGALAARGALPAGQRKGVADENMKLRLTIAVIDFTKIDQGTATSTEASGTETTPAEVTTDSSEGNNQ